MLDPKYFYFRDYSNKNLRFNHPRDLKDRHGIHKAWRTTNGSLRESESLENSPRSPPDKKSGFNSPKYFQSATVTEKKSEDPYGILKERGLDGKKDSPKNSKGLSGSNTTAPYLLKLKLKIAQSRNNQLEKISKNENSNCQKGQGLKHCHTYFNTFVSHQPPLTSAYNHSNSYDTRGGYGFITNNQGLTSRYDDQTSNNNLDTLLLQSSSIKPSTTLPADL